jgi:hypothetical protein
MKLSVKSSNLSPRSNTDGQVADGHAEIASGTASTLDQNPGYSVHSQSPRVADGQTDVSAVCKNEHLPSPFITPITAGPVQESQSTTIRGKGRGDFPRIGINSLLSPEST